MSADKLADRHLSATSMLALLALTTWVVYVRDDGRLWLALAVTSTVLGAMYRLRADLSTLRGRLDNAGSEDGSAPRD